MAPSPASAPLLKKGSPPFPSELVITPRMKVGFFPWRELSESRYVLWNLVRRNFLANYMNMNWGVLWTLLRPVIFVAVFFFIKHRSNANFQQGLPYVLFLYPGVIVWWYFSDAAVASSSSVYRDSGLISKIYFPRVITPLVPVLSGLGDLGIQLTLVPLLMGYFGYHPGWNLVFLPLVIAQVAATAYGLGLILTTISTRTKSRDSGAVLKYVLYVSMFLSPVIFSPSILHQKFRQWYYVLNPMAAPLEMLRVCLYSGLPTLFRPWGFSLIFTAGLLVVALKYFRRWEQFFGDSVL